MPSIKPKIQGYVQPEIFQAFEQWKAEQGIEGVSEALNELFKQFFGFEKPLLDVGLSKEEAESLIEEKLAALQIWAKFAEERIQYLEKVIQPIEGLAEISQPLEAAEMLEESPEDSLQSPLEAKDNSLDLICLEGRCPACHREDMSAIPYEIDNQILFQCLECGWEKIYPLSDAKEFGYIPYVGEEQEPLEDSLQSPSVAPERERQIGDRVRVLCKSSYQGRVGTIIDFDERLGWHVAVDRWWEAVGVAEAVIDERQRRAGNIWCDPIDMELMPQEPKEEPSLSSLEQEDLEMNFLPEIPSQSPVPLEGLKQSDLERRLKTAKGILSKRRSKPDFKEWSRERDPNGVAWQWDAIARKYLAVE